MQREALRENKHLGSRALYFLMMKQLESSRNIVVAWSTVKQRQTFFVTDGKMARRQCYI